MPPNISVGHIWLYLHIYYLTAILWLLAFIVKTHYKLITYSAVLDDKEQYQEQHKYSTFTSYLTT